MIWESAVVITLQPGSYTALLRGRITALAVGVLEVFAVPSTTGNPSPTPSPTATPAAAPKLFIANGGNQTTTKSDVDVTGEQLLAGKCQHSPHGSQGIAVNAAAGKLYAGNEGGNNITQANLDGTGGVNLTLNGLLNGPYGVSAPRMSPGTKCKSPTAEEAYWQHTGFVVRADLDGGNATRLTQP